MLSAMDFTKLLSEYLPTKSENQEIKDKINSFISKLENAVKLNSINAEIMLGGSAAKGTFLKKDFDVDVFVRFDYGYKDQDISGMLISLLKCIKGIQITTLHGSRDYYQVRFSDIKYEIIPVLKVDDPLKAMNVTDMSPLHVNWLKRHLSKNDLLRQDIVLAKLFCKAQGVYGAESYIRGFSGHVLDILIVHYGGFMELLKGSQDWTSSYVIDVEKYGTAPTLNRSKVSPLIIIDPIYPARNAAAALSKEKINEFKKAAKQFLENPSEQFFVKKEYSLADLEKEKYASGSFYLLYLDAIAHDGKEDIVGAKLMKAREYMLNQLRLGEFTVTNTGWTWDKAKKASLWFIVKEEKLSKEMDRVGPPMKARMAVRAFREKHPEAYAKNDRLYAKVPRKCRTPVELMTNLTRCAYMREKVSRISLKVY